MTQRLYTEMSADEQAQWVQDFAQLMEQHGERLALLTKGKATATTDDAAAIRRIFTLLAAWPFAQDFCEKASRYGDYMARTPRLPIYIEKVKERLADGLTMTDAQGRVVAYVNPSTPMRRRGRPTKEEVAARLRGDTITVTSADDAESRKRRAIAKMLGLEVIVHGDAPREKNNAELAAERAARQREYDRQNPSLFSDTMGTGTSCDVACDVTEVPVPNVSPAPQSGTSAACPTMSEVYADRIETDRKLHMDQLKWLCSDTLKRRIEAYHGQRSTFEDASTRAKTMADMGAAPKDIESWTKIAEENLKEYKQTEADIDQELAVLFRRLSIDQPFTDRFKARFKGVDVDKILYMTRPYYEKIREQEKKAVEEVRAKAKAKDENEEQAVAAYLAEHQPIDERVKNLIERDNPEYLAKLKAEEEKKQEIQALHRYIMRKDKEASDERVKTMTERIARLRQLAGDAVADTYLPVLEKTKADNLAWRAARGKAAEPATEKKPKSEKKPTAKKASKK